MKHKIGVIELEDFIGGEHIYEIWHDDGENTPVEEQYIVIDTFDNTRYTGPNIAGPVNRAIIQFEFNDHDR